eukprot:113174_1
MMKKAKSPEASSIMRSSSAVYVGIPLTQAGAVGNLSPSSSPKPSNFKMSGGYGLLACAVSVILGLIACITGHGLAIASIILFGKFDMKRTSAWKHVLVITIGWFSAAFTCWAVFQRIFRDVNEGDKDNDKVKESLPSMKNLSKDTPEAVQDFGEVGFVAGFVGSQIFFESLAYKHLVKFGIQHDYHWSHCFTGALLMGLMLLTLSTFKRAVKRGSTNHVQRIVDSSSAYVQIIEKV